LILLAYYSVYIQVPQVKETMGRKWKERVRDYSIPSSLLFRNNFPKKQSMFKQKCLSFNILYPFTLLYIYLYLCLLLYFLPE